MRRLHWVLVGIAALIGAIPIWGQENNGFEIVQLADHLYKLSIDGGGYTVKVIASVGDDGILLVDSGQEQTAEQLKTDLKTLADGTPKIIINTHEHVEHLGGNAIFGSDPVVGAGFGENC